MDIPPPVEKPKILIVDDHPENLQVLLHTLKQDYAIIAATTGKKALELAEKQPLPDLILLDVMMPDLDGYAVCQQLKANAATQGIPVIFLSALEEAEDETKGFELGAVDYITKPISPPVVKARLKSHLTLQRLNQVLVATNQDLAAATRHKDEFLANMSHELRTPLNTILGFTEALQDGLLGQLNAQQWDALSSIDSSGQHLLSLISDILDLSKIAAGKVELQHTPTAIAELCRTSLLFVQNQAQQKNIQLCCAIPDGLNLVLLDERRIKQVLINLLNNAIKFTPIGGRVNLTVTVETRARGSKGPSELRLLIQVRDTGIGISAEEQKRLFQPFVQINNALNRQQTGTGLGLALVKQIVDLHQGHVWVDSEVDQGSCFSLSLPLRIQAMGTPPTTLNGAKVLPFPTSCSIPTTRPPLVLLAENNPDNRQTLITYLSARRYQVIAVETGQEAIALAENQKPDIILIDIQIPELNGLEVTRALRAHPILGDIPIVAMTSLNAPLEQSRYLEVGMNHVLTKPFRLKELTYVIDRLLAPLGATNEGNESNESINVIKLLDCADTP